jgi:hypothetical protein
LLNRAPYAFLARRDPTAAPRKCPGEAVLFGPIDRPDLFFGNRGSAFYVLHLSAELVVRLRAARPGLPALALTANPSVLTAAGSDLGFEQISSRQIESLAAKGDVLLALSTSSDLPTSCAARKWAAAAAPLHSVVGKSGPSEQSRVFVRDKLRKLKTCCAPTAQVGHEDRERRFGVPEQAQGSAFLFLMPSRLGDPYSR